MSCHINGCYVAEFKYLWCGKVLALWPQPGHSIDITFKVSFIFFLTWTTIPFSPAICASHWASARRVGAYPGARSLCGSPVVDLVSWVCYILLHFSIELVNISWNVTIHCATTSPFKLHLLPHPLLPSIISCCLNSSRTLHKHAQMSRTRRRTVAGALSCQWTQAMELWSCPVISNGAPSQPSPLLQACSLPLDRPYRPPRTYYAKEPGLKTAKNVTKNNGKWSTYHPSLDPPLPNSSLYPLGSISPWNCPEPKPGRQTTTCVM